VQQQRQAPGVTGAYVIVTCLFFAWGFITSLVDPLVAAVKGVFHLSDVEAQLSAFAFFIAYGIMSLPGAVILARRRSVVMEVRVMHLHQDLEFLQLRGAQHRRELLDGLLLELLVLGLHLAEVGLGAGGLGLLEGLLHLRVLLLHLRVLLLQDALHLGPLRGGQVQERRQVIHHARFVVRGRGGCRRLRAGGPGGEQCQRQKGGSHVHVSLRGAVQ